MSAASDPLVVGDRLDTDIEGAVTMGWDSLLVLTGVTGLRELVAAAPEHRPTYVAPDLEALAEPQPAPEVDDDDVAARRLERARRRRPPGCRGRGQRARLVAGRSRSPRGATSTTPVSLSRPTASSLPG